MWRCAATVLNVCSSKWAPKQLITYTCTCVDWVSISSLSRALRFSWASAVFFSMARVRSCDRENSLSIQGQRGTLLAARLSAHPTSTTLILRSSCCAYFAMAIVSSYSRSDFCRKASMVCCSQFIWFLNSSSFILAFMISFCRGIRPRVKTPQSTWIHGLFSSVSPEQLRLDLFLKYKSIQLKYCVSTVNKMHLLNRGIQRTIIALQTWIVVFDEGKIGNLDAYPDSSCSLVDRPRVRSICPSNVCGPSPFWQFPASDGLPPSLPALSGASPTPPHWPSPDTEPATHSIESLDDAAQLSDNIPEECFYINSLSRTHLSVLQLLL